ncbi:TetR-like C-terminal domain-containing protein [Paracoccus sp. (in: a-proteobacteria)]|uniref:TetR-like C-terminal domain-containing protein n=1 Tax=Paracoccus sp. TaxID=267 RepID=UPI003A88CA25
MTPTLSFPHGLGMHERGIAALLTLLAQESHELPEFDEVVRVAKADPDQLRRLFPDSKAVLVAAAEQALVHLLDACTKAVVKVDPDDAMAQFGAVGQAYLDWAATHHVQFRLLSDPDRIDLTRHPALQRYANSIRALLLRMLERARDAGALHPNEDLQTLLLTSGIFAYGLARMVVDQQLIEWCPGEDPRDSAQRALLEFLRRLGRGALRSSSPVEAQ